MGEMIRGTPKAGLSRRGLFAGLLAALGLPGRARAEPAARGALRRVVALRDAQGQNQVLVDGPSPASFELNGTRIVRLWECPGVPVTLPVEGDTAPQAGSAYRADFRGASFYAAEIPPGVGPAQIPMHRNRTLDYMAVLRGAIVLRLPEREVALAQGDTLVLAGCDHSWENRGAETCTLLFVVLPAA